MLFYDWVLGFSKPVASVASDASMGMGAAAVSPNLGKFVRWNHDLEDSHLSHTFVGPSAHWQKSDACHNLSEENKYESCESLSHIWWDITTDDFESHRSFRSTAVLSFWKVNSGWLSIFFHFPIP